MSTDIKLFNGCNHIINDTKYKADDCPLCGGKNIYYDVCFDSQGQIITCSKGVKLQQEVIKILNDKKFSNMFHLEWGNMVINTIDDGLIGKKNLPGIQQKIQMMIYQSLMHLKNVQINNQIIFKNMNDEEILSKIISIKVIPVNNVGYGVAVTFEDFAGNIYTQDVFI